MGDVRFFKRSYFKYISGENNFSSHQFFRGMVSLRSVETWTIARLGMAVGVLRT